MAKDGYIRMREVEYRRLKRREKLLLRLRDMIREHWRMIAPISKEEREERKKVS